MNISELTKTGTKIAAVFSALDAVFPEMDFTGDELANFREYLRQQEAAGPAMHTSFYHGGSFEKMKEALDRLRVIAVLHKYYKKDSLRREMEWVNGR